MAVNQLERAFRAWPVLIEAAMRRKVLTYKELGASLGVHHRAVRYVLGVIQDYCLEEGLPPLTILVVNSSGLPGSGFIAFDVANFEDGFEQVCQFDWAHQQNPFEFAANGDSFIGIVRRLLEEPDTSEEIACRVRSRGVRQLIFRETLLRAYGAACAFTGLSFPGALDACHIIPWARATPAQQLDVRNGVMLNSFHHKLFDSGLITMADSYEIVFYDPNALNGSYSDIDRRLTIDLHGKLMSVPHRLNQRPLPEYIHVHHRLAGWEELVSELR